MRRSVIGTLLGFEEEENRDTMTEEPLVSSTQRRKEPTRDLHGKCHPIISLDFRVFFLFHHLMHAQRSDLKDVYWISNPSHITSGTDYGYSILCQAGVLTQRQLGRRFRPM